VVGRDAGGAQRQWISRHLKDRQWRHTRLPNLEVDVLENGCIGAFGVGESNVIECNQAPELRAQNTLDSSVLVSSFSNLLRSLVACTDFAIHWAIKEYQ
jgi:hypothetical protein